MENKAELKDIARLFLKLGIIGFGGPAAHIAMMQKEVVEKRKWLTEQHFLDLIGATNLIPGPNSTEMAIHIGHEKGGWRGLLVAGLCFILPAVFITGVFAWLYKEYGKLPEIATFIYGIKPDAGFCRRNWFRNSKQHEYRSAPYGKCNFRDRKSHV